MSTSLSCRGAACFVVCTLLAACGDSQQPRGVGALIEIPLLSSDDPARPFNHSAEVTIASRGDTVVLASINFHLPSTDGYDIGTADEFRKRVVVDVSTDGGRTFRAIDPGLGDGTLLGEQTTDPVVRVSSDGTFYLSAVRSKMEGDGAIASSGDGTSWTTLATPKFVDKPWIAIDDSGRQIYTGAAAGYARFALDGTVLQETPSIVSMPSLIADAFVDAGGVHFATVDLQLLDWDGSAAQPTLAATLDGGTDATEYTTVAWSHGPLTDGTWSAHARREGGRGSIVLHIQGPADVMDVPVTADDENAFLPAAAMDKAGRLHIVWYDSAGPTGVLRYAHTLGAAPFAGGLSESIVIDSNATPGGGWYPGFDSDSGARRLREYIGLTVDGDMVHVAWTHSPQPPSRVFTTTIVGTDL